MATAHPSPIEQEIRQRMQDWKASFAAKDVDAMMSFYADGDAFSAFDLMPPIEFRGGDMWRENWVSFFTAFQGPLNLEFSSMEVHAADELAVARVFVRLVGVMNGQDTDMWVRTTNCFRRIDGRWLMIHDHVSVPLDFATGRPLTHLTPEKPFGE
ncbi:ketosteroid isomerase-like protein [Prauserella shujinwangii]|uniref:Ketosteroid isomerase-like protein n=1 Tax=Prauserella shujinwangii TaxID=1453103 RepID=A0A2T0M0G3_9PSEU|nr:nuclear transport factor 2 family protein [Prauserella shujinwangii]PRX50071.1 ketosteroid isomerase-like protein [Prauserella shujinwangii]